MGVTRYLRQLMLFSSIVMCTLLNLIHATNTPLDTIAGTANAFLAASLPLIPMSLAAGIIISCGDIDLSTAGQFSFYGATLLLSASFHIPLYGCLILLLAISGAIGLFQGLLISRMSLPPLQLTLSVSYVLLGISLYAEKYMSVESIPETLPPAYCDQFLSGYWMWGWVGTVSFLLWYWRFRTLSGLRHIAVGANRTSAFLAGINVPNVRLVGFVMAGCLVLITSALHLVSFQQGGWAPLSGTGKELDAITASIIGGTRLSGGYFDPLCIALATILLGAIHGLARSYGLETWTLTFIGAMIMIAAVLDNPGSFRNLWGRAR